MAAASPISGFATAVRDVQQAVTANGSITDDGDVAQLQIIPSTPDLLGLPPELRNTIYHFTMDFAAEENIRNHMRHRRILTRPLGSATFGFTPAILRVCKQTRGECMQLFLASTNFFTQVRTTLWLSNGSRENPFQENHKYAYGSLLHKLDRLGPENVRQIKSITIVSADSGWHTYSRGADFKKLWQDFIPELLSRGLEPHQLRWSGICQPIRRTKEWWKQVERPSEHFPAKICHLEVWYRHVLMPALQMHGCLIPRSPVANVDKQMTMLIHFGTVDARYAVLWSRARNGLMTILIEELRDVRDDEAEFSENETDDSFSEE